MCTTHILFSAASLACDQLFLCQHPEVMSGTTVTRTLSHEMEVSKIITATVQIKEGYNLILI